MCDRNLESAINVFLEGGVSNVPPSNPPSVAAAAAADEEYVRAPIAPVRGRLVDEPYACTLFTSSNSPIYEALFRPLYADFCLIFYV